MWVKVITSFHGKEEGRLLRVGETLKVSNDRGYQMAERGLVVAAHEPPKPKPKRPKKRKKAKKPLEDKAQRQKEDKAEE